MNQSQRGFLIQKVNQTTDKKIEELKKTVPERPSINNYLIAACHDDTLQVLDVKELRAKMKERILKADEPIVDEDENGRWNRRRGNYDDETFKQEVTLNVTDIFILPKAYLEELEKHEAIKKEVDAKIDALNVQRDTIILKIQVGSSKRLEPLVMQIDTIMGDLDLINTQLLTGAADEIKKLTK